MFKGLSVDESPPVQLQIPLLQLWVAEGEGKQAGLGLTGGRYSKSPPLLLFQSLLRSCDVMGRILSVTLISRFNRSSTLPVCKRTCEG